MSVTLDKIRQYHSRLSTQLAGCPQQTQKQVLNSLDATKNAGHAPRNLAINLSFGLYSKAITEKTLPNLLELAKDPPKQGKRDGIDQIIIHGVVAHRGHRIPADMISSYQRRFLENGYFPTGGLLAKYHKHRK